MPKILFIGDVVGRPGRTALARVLPVWKEKYQPDAVVVNVENLAHGKGVTLSTLAEIEALGVDCMTSGNHIFKKPQFTEECFAKYPKLIRPANFGGANPGFGYYRFAKDGQHYLVINLNGQVFMENQFAGTLENPFLKADELLLQEAQKNDIILVDLHAEATSEKIAFGWYMDGRVSAIFGTHTHVPTADARILPKGTAYVTDAGMTGSLNSVIGVKKENVIKRFLDQDRFVNELEEEGPLQVNGLLVETGSSSPKIEKLYQEIA